MTIFMEINQQELNAVDTAAEFREYHFLLVCPLYRELRQKYMKSYYCRWPTLNKFDSLMSSDNKRTILSLAKYIYYASELRRNSQVS